MPRYLVQKTVLFSTEVSAKDELEALKKFDELADSDKGIDHQLVECHITLVDR